MKELDDYSGELKPDLKYEDFSKEALVRLIKTYGRLWLRLLGCWQEAVREKYGLDDYIEVETKALSEQVKYECRWIAKALNIPGNDAITFMKLNQIAPIGFIPGGSHDISIEVKDKNDVILTVNKCFGPAIWEKDGDTEKIREFCHTMEPVAFQAFGTALNPKLKVIPRKLPPRTSETDPFCVWEFKVEP